MGGMGIHDPKDTAKPNYATPRKVCDWHIQLLLDQQKVPGRHCPITETRNRKNTTRKGSSSEGTQGEIIIRGITTSEKAARSHVESRSFLVALSKTIEGKRSASIQV